MAEPSKQRNHVLIKQPLDTDSLRTTAVRAKDAEDLMGQLMQASIHAKYRSADREPFPMTLPIARADLAAPWNYCLVV